MPNATSTYTLRFNADTSQAKKEIDSLKNSLSNLAIKTDISSSMSGIDKAVDASVQSVSKLRVELEKATNPNGTLNAGKLALIWQQSDKSLAQYKKDLEALGPSGEKAFKQLVQSIRTAEEPVRQLDGLIGKFTKGLVNTAMWTIQSNAIHAFQSALSGAFSYAQQLNKGLTDIAIVADMSSEKLAQFAKDANKYAQQWSTTTNEYVKGALIYYQQGLSGEEVIEKTNTTVKLANTSGESAEQISSYMTAIWNNFDDGSKSIEYYADVISYLGAATAASNADIAEGMQAFAATANTVGLSYEYAASALTTLRHVTQQSASTIGNSLKTIFARLSSLKSGDTTEDGIDLTKYTKELATYGVNVRDTNGELKDMDQILDELAERWKTLSNTEKVALAQTVGGVRQYNNLISLMDNYEYFQELVQGSYGSSGYLNRQAEVFEKSWQGALNHIQTAVEKLYDILIDDKLIIGFTNGLAKIIDATGSILENVGGLKVILPVIFGLLSQTYGDKIGAAFKTTKENITSFLQFDKEKEGSKNLKDEASTLGLELKGGFMSDKWNQLVDLQFDYNANLEKAIALSKNLSEEERNQLLLAAERNKYQIDYLADLAQEAEEKDIDIYNQADKSNINTGLFDETDNLQRQMVVAESILSNVKKATRPEDLADYYAKIANDENFKVNDSQLINDLNPLEWSNNISLKPEMVKVLQDYIKNLKDEIEARLQAYLDQEKEDGGYESEDLKLLKQKKALFESKAKKNPEDEETQAKILEINKQITDEEAKRRKEYEQLLELQKQVKGTELEIEQHMNAANHEGERQTSELEKQVAKIKEQRASLEANLSTLIAIGTNLSTLTVSINNIFNIITEGAKKGDLDFKGLMTNIGLFGTQFVKLISNIGKLKPEFWTQGLGQFAVPLLEKLGFTAGEAGVSIAGLGTAGASLGAKFMALLPVLGKILLAIGAVVLAFKGLMWLYEHFTPSGKLQRLTREADESAEAAKKANDAYDDLITTLSKLDDKKDALSKLNQNTYEYKKGVAEANKETQELIEKLHLTNDAWEKQGDFIVIKEEYRKQVIDETAEEAEKANAQSLFDKAEASKQAYENGTGITDVEYASVGGRTVSVEVQPKFDPLTEDNPDFIDYKNNLMFLINDSLEGDISNGALNEVADYIIKEGIFGNLIKTPEELSAWLSENLNGIIQDAIDNNRLTKEDLDSWNLESAFQEAFATAIGHGFEASEITDMMDYIQKHWEDLNLPEDIQQDKAAIVELVDDILRFNRATEETRENYDEWMSSLESGNIQDLSTALKEMRSTYGDLLDMDGDNFSEEFVKSKKNLDLMKEAINGNEKAYKQLYEIAKKDLYTNLHINVEDVSKAENALENFAQSVYGRSWDDIEVGVFINDEAAIRSLNNLINAAADTATTIEDKYAAMNDVLAASGVDADIESIEVPESQKEQYIDAIPEINYDQKAKVPVIVQDGMGGVTVNETEVSVPTINYTGEPDPPVEANEGKKTVTVFRLKNARKASGGGFKYKHATAGGGNGGSKGSGGGGGGHEKKAKKKDTKRYHEVDAQLKQNKNALDLLNQAKDRAFGRGKIKDMEQEVKLLEQQAELYKELAKQAQSYYEKDRNKLASQYGAKFNEDGTIDNFEAWYDSFVDKYNHGGMEDDAWEAFEEAISKYEDSLDRLHQAEQGYNEAMNKAYDLRLEKIVYRVKYLNELIELSTDYLDYLIEKLDEDMYDTADVVADLGKKASNVLEQIDNIQKGIVDALSDKDNHPKMTAELIEGYLKGEKDLQEVLNNISQLTDGEQEQLRDWMKQLIDYNKELRKTQKEAYDKIIESVEEFNEKIKRQQDIVNDTAGAMEHYANVIDIIGKDTLGISDAMMNALNDLQVTGAQANLTIATNQLNQNKAILAEIQKNLEEAREKGTESDVKLFEEKLEQQEDIVRELAEEWASAYEDALKSAQDAFTNGVKLATEAFDKAVSGSIGSLDKLQDFYDKQTTLQDIFLPDYERIHDLSKLARDINNAINATDNIKGKERLRNLQNEILEAQREGTELSKYDMEFMQKRFELEQAQIAMEEQRNAKNLVRMTRDNEGNWSYTYTQNPENVAKAQQEFEDKLYDLEKLNQDRVKETQQLMLNAMEKFRDEIANADMNDQEKTQALLDYWRQLQEEYGNLTDTALKDGKWITDTYDVSNHELTDSFEETLLSLGTGYQTLEDFMNDFRSASATMGDDVAAQYQKWGDYVKVITEAAGINFDNFAQRVADDMDLVIAAMIGEDGNGGAVGVAKQLADEMGISIDDILKELRTWWDGPEGRSFIMEAEIAENEKTYEQLEKLIANADQIPVELPKISQAIQKIASGGGNECGCGATCTTTCWTDCGSNGASQPKGCGCGSNCSGGCKTGCGKSVCEGQCVGGCLSTCAEHCADGCSISCSYSSAKVGTNVAEYGYKPPKTGLATGGYTGAWGSWGKIAMLHEKELVLNKEDTANMLATVGFVRDLVEMLTTNAGIAASGFGNLFAGGVDSGGNYLDQNVTIHAEFPNATNHSEIEEAFQNLIGLAGQYAGRKQ